MPQSAAPFRGSLSAGNHRSAAMAAWAHGFDPDLASRWAGPPRWLSLWIPVIVSLAIQVAPLFLLLRFTTRLPNLDSPGEFALAVGILSIGPGALIAARRFPGPVVAIVAAAAALAILYGGEDWPPYISLGFAIVAAIIGGARMWAWISVAVAWVTTLVVALSFGTSWAPVRITGVTLGILVFFGIGEAIRGRREHFEEYRRQATQRRLSAEQAERMRLARELHDVLAHSLSQINVQAGVGLHLMDSQPEKAADALANIKLTSKTALDEVRSVLGILRADGSPEAPLIPEPDLSRLAGLATSVTQQGVAVTIEEDLTTNPPAAIQLAIFRIAQESLTNVVRHAHAAAATVTLHEVHGEYVLTISDNGTASSKGAAPPSGAEPGKGLLGMKERAELHGGSFRAQRSAQGGFEVEARFPISEARS